MKLSFTFTFILSAYFLFAQNNYEDVVYLKDGSIIHGMIIEQIPNTSVKIQTADQNILVFKMEQIEKITKEPVAKKESSQQEAGALKIFKRGSFDFNAVKEKGFIFAPDIGVLMGVGSHTAGDNFFEYKMTFAGRLSRQTYIGAGFGLDVLGKNVNPPLYNVNYFPGHTLLAPVFLEARTGFMKRRISPYFSQAAGYSFFIETPTGDLQDYIGGVMLQTQVGARVFINPKIAVYFALGYRFQHLLISKDANNYADYSTLNGLYGYPYYYYNYPYYNYPAGSAQTLYYHFITLHWGVSF